VFWSYETLFNSIDRLEATLTHPRNRNKSWAKALQEAIKQMHGKLSKYYQRTEHPFVYADAVILEPSGKLLLFEQDSFESYYRDYYSKECRLRYIQNYEAKAAEPVNLKCSRKRKRAGDESDGDDDYYRALLKAEEKTGIQNEYDLYISGPRAPRKRDPLGWWRTNAPSFPHLAMMFRDTFAVTATGAGVEREFSKSGRVASWTRARLNHTTITDTMLFKNMLTRHGEGLKAIAEAIDNGIEEEIDDEDEDVEQQYMQDLYIVTAKPM
jgi:hypothetical protein